MNKWRLIKALFKIVFNILLVVSAVLCINGFFNAELIVDKVHYGFILTFILLFLCDGNNGRGGNVATS